MRILSRLQLSRYSIALILLLMHSVGLAQQSSAQAVDAKHIQGQRVFVTGHSFHAWIGTPLNQIAQSAGVSDHRVAGQQSIGGSQVIQHWVMPDDKNKAKAAIKSGEVDVLTVSPVLKLPDQGIENFTDLLLEYNPHGRLYVQASWFPWDLPGNTNRNFQNSDRDSMEIAKLREGYKTFYDPMTKQVETLNERLHEKTQRQAVFLVPVGHAVYALREQIAEGKFPGMKQSDLFRDPIGHPHAPIAALAAYCYFAAIYHTSPVGLPMPRVLADVRNPAWDDKFNETLQQIAWEAVINEPLSGVKKEEPVETK